MHFFFDDQDDGDDDNTNDNGQTIPGTEAGTYALPDDIGERIGEGEDHNPVTLGND